MNKQCAWCNNLIIKLTNKYSKPIPHYCNFFNKQVPKDKVHNEVHCSKFTELEIEF